MGMMVMIGLVMASALISYTIVAVFMSSRPVISRFQNTQHWTERAAGVCFVAIGGKILADSRSPVAP
jgi:threonine/homoserine/homoserine lactone efflux protein